MAYEDEPTQKRPPRPWRAAPRAVPFSPMPALGELVPPQLWGAEQANQPTEPLPHLDSPPEHIQQPTGSTSDTNAAERVRRLAAKPIGTYPAKEEKMASTRFWRDRGSRRLLPRVRSLEKPRSRRSSMLRTALLLLLLLGGLVLSSCYVLETAILGPLAQFFHPIGTGGSIDGRAWNLLLLGSDNDQKYVFPDLLTQVVMVAHVDPVQKRVSLVSIPRDSWLPVPGHTGMYKLDQAFFLGATPHRSFDEGARLARATIEQDYGIPIDRYIWVGLGGFASVIDTLGGVDIDLTHPLVDDTYPDDSGSRANPHDPYAFTRLYLPPGPQHLSGALALQYVRSRHADLIGDIGRTVRQQQVLAALRNKLNASNVIEHLPQLLRTLAGRVYTDLSQSELLSMANVARDLSPAAISHLTLGPGPGRQNYGSLTHTNAATDGESQDIITPNCANIQPTLNEIFGLGDAQSCQIDGS